MLTCVVAQPSMSCSLNLCTTCLCFSHTGRRKPSHGPRPSHWSAAQRARRAVSHEGLVGRAFGDVHPSQQGRLGQGLVGKADGPRKAQGALDGHAGFISSGSIETGDGLELVDAVHKNRACTRAKVQCCRASRSFGSVGLFSPADVTVTLRAWEIKGPHA